MKRCRGPINPILMMNRAGHRLFQKVAPGKCMHAAGGGDDRCFYIVSAEIGVPFATVISVCFNVPPNAATCHDIPSFSFQTVERGPYDQESTSGYDFGPNCLGFSVDYVGEGSSGTSPLDNVRLDYTPGACHKEGDNDPECLLEAYSNFPVKNSIWGPTSTRIGDLGDDIVVVQFPTTPADVGPDWQIKVNDLTQAGVTDQIVNDTIQFTLPAPVTSSDEVVISHLSSFGCRAVDGRWCWRFNEMPVLNTVGVGFWNREDAGPWLLEPRTGRWRLEN